MAISSREDGPSEPGDDSPDTVDDESKTRDNPDARAGDRPVADLSWPLRYARDHLVHVAVVLVFAVYPGIYTLASNSPLTAEVTALLPRIETLVVVLFFALFAMSFDFISGYTGYLSFGHAAFYGTGAYLVVLAANGKLPLLGPETPFMLLLVLAGLAAAVVAVVIGSVSFRLSGVYFAMITLGFSQVLYVFVRDWDFVGSTPQNGVAVTGTTEGFRIGVPGVDSLSVAIGQLTGDSIDGFLGFISLSATEVSFYAVGAVVLVCYLLLQRLVHSPFGRALVAIRENEERARAVGYNTYLYKLTAFVFSGFFAGVAGALFAGFRRSVTPENGFYFLVAGDALLASILGGFGTLAGPLYGRLFDQSAREFLSKEGGGGGLLPYLRDNLGEATLSSELFNGVTISETIDTFLNGHAALFVGLLFVCFVLYVPDGVLGTLRMRYGGPLAKVLPRRLADWLGN